MRKPGDLNAETDEFPVGKLYSARPFMYTAIVWFIMPTYVVLRLTVYAAMAPADCLAPPADGGFWSGM
jgi:hypothetical protein